MTVRAAFWAGLVVVVIATPVWAGPPTDLLTRCSADPPLLVPWELPHAAQYPLQNGEWLSVIVRLDERIDGFDGPLFAYSHGFRHLEDGPYGERIILMDDVSSLDGEPTIYLRTAFSEWVATTHLQFSATGASASASLDDTRVSAPAPAPASCKWRGGPPGPWIMLPNVYRFMLAFVTEFPSDAKLWLPSHFEVLSVERGEAHLIDEASLDCGSRTAVRVRGTAYFELDDCSQTFEATGHTYYFVVSGTGEDPPQDVTWTTPDEIYDPLSLARGQGGPGAYELRVAHYEGMQDWRTNVYVRKAYGPFGIFADLPPLRPTGFASLR